MDCNQFTELDLAGCKAQNKDEETYYITKENEYGNNETILSLKCDLEDAEKAFLYIIREQVKEKNNFGEGYKWKVLRLFESKTDKQIRQES